MAVGRHVGIDCQRGRLRLAGRWADDDVQRKLPAQRQRRRARRKGQLHPVGLGQQAVGGAQAVAAGGLHCGAGQQPCQGGDAAAHHALVPRTACTRATPLRQPMASATGAGRLASQPRE